MVRNPRFMTFKAKQKELVHWERAKVTLADRDMILYCDSINLLPRVVTLQSCAGHSKGEESFAAPGDRNTIRPAHLWLWFDELAAEKFRVVALEVATHPSIELVSTMYLSWGQEITNLVFAGNERNPTGLTRSMGFLCETLLRVACQ